MLKAGKNCSLWTELNHVQSHGTTLFRLLDWRRTSKEATEFDASLRNSCNNILYSDYTVTNLQQPLECFYLAAHWVLLPGLCDATVKCCIDYHCSHPSNSAVLVLAWIESTMCCGTVWSYQLYLLLWVMSWYLAMNHLGWRLWWCWLRTMFRWHLTLPNIVANPSALGSAIIEG